jgi:hypothetical protein
MTKIINKVAEFLGSTSPRAWKFCMIAVICFAASVLACMLAIKTSYVVNIFPPDYLFLCDAGWRVLCGQIAHNDFYCPLGASIPYLLAFGLRVFPSINVFVIANLLVYFPFALLLYFVAKDRVPAFWLLILEVFLGACIVTPRPLGYPLGSLSPAMFFNRWGEAIFALLVVTLFFSPYRPLKSLKQLSESFLTGVLIALLLFIKISYFDMAVVALAWHTFINRPDWRRLGCTAIGFTLILMVFAVLGIHFSDMYADLCRLTTSQNKDFRTLQIVMKLLGICPKGFYSGTDLGCEGVLTYLEVTAVLLFAAMKIQPPGTNRLKIAVTSLCIFVCGWAFYTVNFQIGDAVVTTLAPIFLFHYIWRSRRQQVQATAGLTPELSTGEALEPTDKSLRSSGLMVAGWILAFSLALIITAKDLITLSYVAQNAIKQEPIPTTHRISSDKVGDTDWPESYANYINSALSLLRATNSAKAKIFAVDYVNPYPFLLGALPPRGNPLYWWCTGSYTFTAANHLPAEKIFEDVDVVLLPKATNEYDYAATPEMKRIYGQYLGAHFKRKADNDIWDLLVRR